MDEFFSAVCRGDGEEVQGMLNLYDNSVLDVPDELSFTPLMYTNCPGIELLLLIHNHNVDAKDFDGRTALMHRIMDESDGWLFYGLIKYGADWMIEDNEGFSALQLAMVNSQEDKLLAAWIKTYFCGNKRVEDLSFDQIIPIIATYEANTCANMVSLCNQLERLVVDDIDGVLERVEVYFEVVKVMIADNMDEGEEGDEG